jgi:hypothetical protein
MSRYFIMMSRRFMLRAIAERENARALAYYFVPPSIDNL